MGRKNPTFRAPVGLGDDAAFCAAVDKLSQYVRQNGWELVFHRISRPAMERLTRLYPDRFEVLEDRDNADYVYERDALANLSGKKYHAKRNHLNRFREAFPNAVARPIDDAITPAVREFVAEWYATKRSENPNGDFRMEEIAIERALRDREVLGLEGLTVMDGDRILAMTFGSRLSYDTFDVHFEKARADVQGAYPAINCEFARYLREKYPEVKYLDREEDMGLEGLRRAKKSYYPHHMIEKCWAHLLEDGYEY